MKRKSLAMVMLVVGVSLIFAAAGLYAGTKAEDVIKMDGEYPHTKGIVDFSHKKHSTDYKIGCGECHHDKDGKPLADMKEGDEVQKCNDCHKKPGEIKGKEAKDLQPAQKREYHANAVHDNCIGCHKEFNKKNNTTSAPASCNKCHPGKEKE